VYQIRKKNKIKEQIEGKESASLFDMPTLDLVNTHDVQNYVVAGIDESEGENNMAIDDTVVGEAQLAAIPEALPVKSASLWSKRRAGDTDEDSLERATKLKAHRNEGDKLPDHLTLSFTDSCIQTNLGAVGILIGQNRGSIDASVASLRDSVQVNSCDRRTTILENEFLEFKQEGELDKIILNQLCGEIMEEVMYLGECTDDMLTAPGSKTSSKRERKILINKSKS
jgi:hypothetical protein